MLQVRPIRKLAYKQFAYPDHQRYRQLLRIEVKKVQKEFRNYLGTLSSNCEGHRSTEVESHEPITALDVADKAANGRVWI